jgi:hypothetical protein
MGKEEHHGAQLVETSKNVCTLGLIKAKNYPKGMRIKKKRLCRFI